MRIGMVSIVVAGLLSGCASTHLIAPQIEPADRDRLSIGFGGTWAAKDGQPLADYDETPVAAHLAGQYIRIDVDLGMGDGRATVWTCDLTHGYISINADYRS